MYIYTYTHTYMYKYTLNIHTYTNGPFLQKEGGLQQGRNTHTLPCHPTLLRGIEPRMAPTNAHSQCTKYQ